MSFFTNHSYFGRSKSAVKEQDLSSLLYYYYLSGGEIIVMLLFLLGGVGTLLTRYKLKKRRAARVKAEEFSENSDKGKEGELLSVRDALTTRHPLTNQMLSSHKQPFTITEV